MSSSLYTLGRRIARAHRLVAGLWVLLLLGIGAFTLIVMKGTDDSFSIPGGSSQVALEKLQHTFPELAGTQALIMVVGPQGSPIDKDPAVKQAFLDGKREAEALKQVIYVNQPFDPGVKGAINADRRAAIMTVFLSVDLLKVTPATRTDLQHIADELQQRLGDRYVVHLGGDAFSDRIPHLSPTELIGLVVAFVVLLITFGSFLAAGLPLATAGLGVGVSAGLIYAATSIATISATAPMVAVMIGLAVGIDYSLFILSRHRDQLRGGMDVEESVAQSLATAGSAVVFAGLTVFIALVGLFIAGIPYLTTMGFSAALAVFFAVIIALTGTPALLAMFGERLRPRPRRLSWGLPWGAGRTRARRAATGEQAAPAAVGPRWARAWVGAVTRWPAVTIVLVIGVLGYAALPAANLRLALPDNGTMNPGTAPRSTYDAISEYFGPGYNAPLIVTLDVLPSTKPIEITNAVAADLAKVPGVAGVPFASPNRKGEISAVLVLPTTAQDAPATEDLVNRLRAMAPQIQQKYGVSSAVTGITAVGIDVSNALRHALLPFGTLVVGLSLILLAMVFRSVAVPIKATLGYLLSLGAAFGITSRVWMDGWGADVLSVQHVGSVISFLPIILMGVLFGLAMDYEVFLVSRVREHYVHHGNAREAIKVGIASAASVVVSAAIIMIAVFAAFVPVGTSTVKPVAFALAVGVFADAFIVRMTLVPAVLQVLGDRAWWLPRWLDRRLPFFDAEGEGMAHVAALADWPAPGGAGVVLARDVAVLDEHGRRVVTLADLSVAPGQVVVVDGGSGSGKTALLHTLAGHVTSIEGDLKVLGHVLPQHNRAVRREVELISCRVVRDPVRAARAAVADGVRLVLLDDIDQVVDARQRDQLHALFTDPDPGVSPPAYVVTCAERATLHDLLGGAPVVTHTSAAAAGPQLVEV